MLKGTTTWSQQYFWDMNCVARFDVIGFKKIWCMCGVGSVAHQVEMED